MKKVFFLISIVILLVGCTTQTNVADATVSNNTKNQSFVQINTTQGNATRTCSDYCPSLPHIQCLGNWNISGTYPNCNCIFQCNMSSDESSTTTANDTNLTPALPNESSSIEQFTTPINTSVEQMLENGLEKQRNKFYLEHNGAFNEKTYTWLRQNPNIGSGISFDTSDEVKFDNVSIKTIQASGFILFENKRDKTVETYGVSIFKDKKTRLDNYTGTDAFDIIYFSPLIDKNLHDCWTYEKEYDVDTSNAWFLTYYFHCEKVQNKSS